MEVRGTAQIPTLVANQFTNVGQITEIELNNVIVLELSTIVLQEFRLSCSLGPCQHRTSCTSMGVSVAVRPKRQLYPPSRGNLWLPDT